MRPHRQPAVLPPEPPLVRHHPGLHPALLGLVVLLSRQAVGSADCGGGGQRPHLFLRLEGHQDRGGNPTETGTARRGLPTQPLAL